MVFHGFQLPQKNLDARLRNLNTSIKNNALLIANSRLLIQSMNEIKKETDNVSLSTQTTADSNALVDLATMNQLSIDDLARKRNLSVASSVSEPSSLISVGSEPITAKERAIQSALLSAKERANKEGRVLSKEEEINIIDNVNKQSNVLSGLDLARKPKTSVSRAEIKRWIKQKTLEDEVKKVINNIINTIEDENEAQRFIDEIQKTVDDEVKKDAELNQKSEDVESQAPTSLNSMASWVSSVDNDFSKLTPEQQRAVNLSEILQNDVNNFSAFLSFYNSLKKSRITNMNQDNRKNPFFRGFYKDTNGNIKSNALSGATKPEKLNKMWQFLESDRDNYIKLFNDDILANFGSSWKGGKLVGSGVKPYYAKNLANFGNLFLSENSLKKNTLTIYRPKSKLLLITKKNISPLLKKMVLDIQNTLEFDESDYNNLDADEKRVIERIIRLQQNMKDYNIKKLIDDDEVKIKKRLDILTAQINAGNNSKMVRDEMKYLVKQLFKNNAISQGKYNNLLKSINALA